MNPTFAERRATEARKTAFMERCHFKLSRGNTCYLRVIGKRPRYYCHREPWIDHAALYVRDRRAVLFHSQPYGLSEWDRADLESTCSRHGLAWAVTTHPEVCWYFPGACLSVLVWNIDSPCPIPANLAEAIGVAVPVLPHAR